MEPWRPWRRTSEVFRFQALECRASARQTLVEYVRKRLSRQLEAAGASPGEVEDAKHLFDPNALTLGFARRFTPYKRPNLLLHDRDRLLRILTNPRHPVQLLIAGKAHPADVAGQALIQWTDFIRWDEIHNHLIFLSDRIFIPYVSPSSDSAGNGFYGPGNTQFPRCRRSFGSTLYTLATMMPTKIADLYFVEIKVLMTMNWVEKEGETVVFFAVGK